MLGHLQQFLFHEFPARIADQGKEYALPTYLNAVKSEGFLQDFVVRIKNAESKKDLRDYLKDRLGLPLGLRNALVNGSWDVVRGWRIGHIIDSNFKVIGSYGEGSFGTVHKVLHVGWNKPLAVKVGAKIPLKDFIKEAELWIGLGVHPNIVTALFVRVIQRDPCIFIEAIEGGNLADLILQNFYHHKQIGPTVYHFMISIGWALEHAHNSNIAHLDLKPENIMVESNPTLDFVAYDFKVTDFGAARLITNLSPEDTENSVTTRVVGDTLVYMSPEQRIHLRSNAKNTFSHKLSFPSDVFSMALVFLDVIRGNILDNVRKAEWIRHRDAGLQSATNNLIEEAIRQSPLPQAIIVPLKPLLQSCLEMDPSHRPTMDVLAYKLTRLYEVIFHSPYPLKKPKAARNTLGYLNNRALSEHELCNFDVAHRLWLQALTFKPADVTCFWNYNLSRLRSGDADPSNIIAIIKQSVLRGDLSHVDGEAMISALRHEGGHMTSTNMDQYEIHEGYGGTLDSLDPSDNRKEISRVHCSFPYLSVTAIRTTDDGSALAVLWPMQLLYINANGETSEHLCRSSYQPLSSRVNMWWYYKPDSNDISVTSSSLEGHSNYKHRFQSQDGHVHVQDHIPHSEQNYPALTVGENISVQGGTIDVDRVISVDVTLQNHQDCILDSLAHFVVLCEGRWASGVIDAAVIDVEDAKSDLGEDIDEPRGELNSGGEERDVEADVIAQRRKYFLAFSAIVRGCPSVHTIRLVEDMVQDQCPVVVRIVDTDLAILAGVGGLLGVVRQHGDTATSSASVLHLNKDDYARDVDAKVYHPIDSCVNIIDYSYTGGRMLVSGDDHGVINVWKLPRQEIPDPQPFAPSLELGSRISSIRISGSGRTIVVGLVDRLLLIDFNREGLIPNMYIRSELDVSSSGGRAMYDVCFGSECITIWRLSLNASHTTLSHSMNSVVSVWTHANVENPAYDNLCSFR